jgi:cobalt-zinc-cadmium efflux system outer membrane protein
MQLSVAVAYAQSTAVSGSSGSTAPATNTAAATPASSSVASHALLHNDIELARWVVGHSADVNASRAELRAQRATASGTRLFINPSLEVGVGNFALGRTNPPGYPRSKTLLYDVGISQTIELGKRGSRIAAADLQATSAQARLQGTVAGRVGVARGALAELLYNRVRAQQLEASLEEAHAATAIAKGRLAHDALSGVDYDRLLIDLAALEIDRAHAEADALSALAQCEAALQAPCDVDADVDTLDAAAPVPAIPATDDDLRQRADIRSLGLDAQASAKSAELAAARAIPDLTFRLGYTHDTFTISGSLSDSLALSVSAPIPVFDRGQYDKAAALANAAQSREQARAEWIRARGDLSGLYARKKAVEGALYNLEHDSLPRANGVLEAEERGLKEGQLDLNDLLLARRAAIAVRLQTLELHFELFQVRNALRQVMGLDQALTQG